MRHKNDSTCCSADSIESALLRAAIVASLSVDEKET